MTTPAHEAAREAPLACPGCDGVAVAGRFDATFRGADDPPSAERNLFWLPGALCVACAQLFVDQGIILALGLESQRCVFAILSDAKAKPKRPKPTAPA